MEVRDNFECGLCIMGLSNIFLLTHDWSGIDKFAYKAYLH